MISDQQRLYRKLKGIQLLTPQTELDSKDADMQDLDTDSPRGPSRAILGSELDDGNHLSSYPLQTHLMIPWRFQGKQTKLTYLQPQPLHAHPMYFHTP